MVRRSKSGRLHARASLLALVAWASGAGCSSSSASSGAMPPSCMRDADCGSQAYCTEALVCRTDCYVDADCIGPGRGAQCNAQGRCIAPVPDGGIPLGDDVGGETGDDATGEAGA
jgi:hypothetical protein